MADFMISLALGGLLFWLVRWLIFRKPFPYPLSIAEQRSLGKILTKLSDGFEAIERTRDTQYIGMRGSIDGLPAKTIADLEASVLALGEFSPEVVTYVTLGHMRTSTTLGREIRAQAQSRLLEMLNREGLAVPAEVFA
ncbi:hypothetical protein [uncultured Parasphingorhabdus sp.]|uniref:hypothetical protein n=1 Tax=uncultured Parasphingorhabdus sp. TaxID=2709694 RepID=UPI0030D9F947